MKSFFKKLSLVLAAALVITMLPVQSAKAATKVSLGKDKASAAANTAQAFTFEVGDTEKWNFYGVTDYNAAGGKTKKWVSSNTAVVTVANGQVTAVAAGKAKITFTVTNNGIDYIGTADVTVVEKNAQSAGAPVVKQVAYNEIDVIFDTAEEAKEAKDGIKVNRVKQSKTGSDIKLYVAFAKEIDRTNRNVLKIKNLSDKVTYEITVPGYATPWTVTMAVGTPVRVKLSYPTAYISTKKGMSKDISGKTISAPVVSPIAVVVDKNDIICESKTSGFSYTTDKTKNQGNVVVSSNGQITFREASAVAYVKCDYSYKDANGKQIKVDYDEVTVSPVPYSVPNYQGFVEKITLTSKSGNEVVYPDDYSYTATLAVGQEQSLAFYFETPDGDLYAPEFVQKTVKGPEGTKKENESISIIKADGANYSYYAKKDDESKAVVSLRTLTSKEVKVKALSEGEETICIYERADGTKSTQMLPEKDKLVGVLTITVLQEPEVVAFNLDVNSVSGFYNTQLEADKYLDIAYKLEDQYGNEIEAMITVLDENKIGTNAIRILKADKTDASTGGTLASSGRLQKAGVIRIDATHSDMRNLPTEGKTFIVSTKLQKNVVTDSFIVSTSAIDVNSTDRGYGLMISTKKAAIKNSEVKTRSKVNERSVVIDVVNTRDNNRLNGDVEFYVVKDEDITATQGNAANSGKLVVVITREDNTVLQCGIDGEETASFLYASEIGTSAAVGACAVRATSSYSLWLVKNQDGVAEATIDANSLLKGTYNVTLYQLNNGQYPTYITSEQFTVSDNIEGIKQIHTRNQLYIHDRNDIDNKGKVMDTPYGGTKHVIWDEAGANYPTGVDPERLVNESSAVELAERKELVEKIIGELYCWIDLDCNGSAVDSNGNPQEGEVKQIRSLINKNGTAGAEIIHDSSKYIFGTDPKKEVYIKYVTLQYRIGEDSGTGPDSAGALITQTIDINTKYTFK